MTLHPGARIDTYEVISLLGAGGMGEVYKARDSRLDREVALKVLPTSFARDAERLRRFEQEAKTTGALNHPNILSVFDFGLHDGAPYMAAELLEGETLRVRMEEGPLPARKALELAAQVARGLAAAHDKGIVHRDLKPENLFVTSDGRIKILDFGLAKLTQPDTFSGSQGNPTLPVQTEPGAILGSVGYMSPEQVRGAPSDTRTDIFAFGAILYEMVTGKRAFKKETAVETMSAILREEPAEISMTQLSAGPALERIIRHCLEKNPAERFQSARDLAFQLEAVSGSDTTSVFAYPALRGNRLARILPWSVALVALAALGFTLLRQRPAAPARPLAVAVVPPAGADFSFLAAGGSAASLQLSPDGKLLLYAAAQGGGDPQLWLREMGSLRARPLPGTAGASFPFWSPDSDAIAFFQEKKLKRMAFDGGPPQTICEATLSRGGSWGPGGVILFAPDYQSVINKVNAAGGTPEPVTAFDAARKETTHRWPFFLPDGKHFLYFAGRYGAGVDSEANSVKVGSLDGKSAKFVLNSPAGAQFSAGQLLFFRQGGLMAQPFDPGRLELSGSPRRIAESVDFTVSYFYARFTAAREGLIAYQAAAVHGSQPAWYDLSGKKIGELGRLGAYMESRLSPDGGRWAAAFVDPENGSRKLWIFPGAGGPGNRITNEESQLDLGPVFSPDGKTLVYSSFRAGRFDLYLKDLAGESRPLYESGDTHKFPTDFSPDGKTIAFQQRHLSGDKAENHEDIWILPAGDPAKAFPFIATAAVEMGGRFSPDGRWFAYQSDETGRPEVYVTSFPAHQGKWQISTGGGSLPAWRRDGKALFFSDAEGALVTAEIRAAAGTVTASPARPLFAAPPSFPIASFEVAPSGDKVLIIPQDPGNRAAVTLLVDWDARGSARNPGPQ
jgi:Tol biopolymer transport system component